jgi:hypothetical protein
MKSFSWGKVLKIFDYDIDGKPLEIVKYHPWHTEGVSVNTGNPNEAETLYHVNELHASYLSIEAAMIAWVAYKRLGLNQHALVTGVCRALCV